MTPYLILGGLLILGAFLWFARKAGKDSVKSKAAEETVEQIVEAHKPVDTAARERLRTRYRRD